MEGSSEGSSQRKKGDHPSRGLHYSAVSDGDRRLLGSSVVRSTDDHTSQGSVFNADDGLDRSIECSDVSLRQWLDNPERTVDSLECLHIFIQIVDIVNLAHSQGVVVHNIRPSCFVVSSYNRVSFIESASCSDSGSDSCEEGLNNQTDDASHLVTEMTRRTASDLVSDTSHAMPEQVEEEKPPLPMKQILLMEITWYTSPEELVGEASSCASDVYRLGVLLFELFCTFSSVEQKSTSMSSLRHRVLPPQLLLKWLKEASFCLWLLHPDPNSRPKMGDLMQSEFLNEPRNHLLERDGVIELREIIEEQDLLLEFLSLIQQRKEEAADSLHETISFLSSDIDKVMRLWKALGGKEGFSSELGSNSVSASTSTNFVDDDDSGSMGSLKRFRPGLHAREEYNKHTDEEQKSAASPENQAHTLPKSSRLAKNFRKLEAAYFLTRRRAYKPVGKPSSKHPHPVISDGREFISVTDGSPMRNVNTREKISDEDEQNAWVLSFLEGLCKYLSLDKLKVKADLKQADLLNSSNLVCSLGFDRDGEFFATAGVNKKIKVFEYNSILDEDRDTHYPVVEMGSKSNMSSICWNPYIKSQIASSNFEGVVQVWDVTRSQIFSEMREHERRIWSVDISVADPTMLASGSDDCSVKLWNINQGASVGTIRAKANVCCVQFQSGSSHCLAFGSADHRIYYYDLRSVKMPVCTLTDHNKTVSYVKFIDSTTLVSASIDNSLKLWDLAACTSRVIKSPLHSFTGHVNIKNFVGLSVSDGYIATGSETNEVFIYHKAFPMPALSYKFNSADTLSGEEEDDSPQFISSVCWRGQSSTLLAANSLGNIKILEMV